MVIGSAATSLLSPREFGVTESCCSSHGWCGCCCKDAFDEEGHFEAQMQREMERTRDKSKYKLVMPVETEPEATEGMIQGPSTARRSYEVPLTAGDSACP